MKYKYLLFDADDTLLDFKNAEKNAFYKLLTIKGIIPTPLLHKLYSDINLSVWKRFEKNEVKKEEIGVTRYREFLEKIGEERDAYDFDSTYHKLLGYEGGIIPGADKVCAELKARGYSINIATNGFEDTQKQRFSLSGLNDYIDSLYISECLKVQKPDKEFFNKIFEDKNCFDREKYLIIGDSLTSDILGGVSSGIDTCWYNPENTGFDKITPSFSISSLSELLNIL